MNNTAVNRKTAFDIIYLIRCALDGSSPDDERLRGMDLCNIYSAAKSRTLTSAVYMGLENSDILKTQDADFVKKWRAEKDMAVRKDVLFEAEYKNVVTKLEAAGIWYMPLKGMILKSLYPRVGMRQMADMDILFDPERSDDVHRILTDMGYESERVGRGNADSYLKPPIYNIEMHPKLVSQSNIAWDYYEQAKLRIFRQDESSKFKYYLSDDDFYIYMVCHAYKHYRGSGTGIRTLMDEYVFIQKKNDSLDWDYLHREFEKLEISEFEEKCRKLSWKLFGCGRWDLKDDATDGTGLPEETEKYLTEDELAELDYYITSDTYGSKERRISNTLQRMKNEDGEVTGLIKLKYLAGRIAPSQEWYEENRPFFAKHRWLKPVHVVARFFRGIAIRRKNIKEELKKVRKM